MGPHRRSRGLCGSTGVHPDDRDGAVAQCELAAATLLFEAVRQRQAAVTPTEGEGLSLSCSSKPCSAGLPQAARWCRDTGRPYLGLSSEGELLEELPRTVKLRCRTQNGRNNSRSRG